MNQNNIDLIEDFFQAYLKEEVLNLNKDNPVLLINFSDLAKFSLNLSEELLNDERVLQDFQRALNRFHYFEDEENIYHIEVYNLPRSFNKPIISTKKTIKYLRITDKLKLEFFQAWLKDKDLASEILVKHLMNFEKFYSIRDDDNPEMWIYNNGIYIPHAKTFIKEFCREILGKLYSSRFVNKVIDKIEAQTYVDKNFFFKNHNPEEVVLLNGVLNVVSGEFSSFTSEKIFFNKLPVKFDLKANCFNIKKHFQTVLKDELDYNSMQELLGYCLLKENKFEKAFMFHGEGRNGKSKTLEIIRAFIGFENCSNIQLQQLDQDKFIMSELFNKFANIGSEIGSSMLEETNNFKALVGRDLVTAQRKFKSPVQFVNYSKLIFCTNNLPQTKDMSAAFFNRWIFFSFPFTFCSKKEFLSIDFSKQDGYRVADPDISQTLTTSEELSGLLNWCLLGLKRLLLNKDFSNNKGFNSLKLTWIRKSNSLEAFLIDLCEFDFNSKVLKSDLRRAYSQYCQENNIKTLSDRFIYNHLTIVHGVTSEQFYDDLDKLRFWSGLKFKEGVVDHRGVSLLPDKYRGGFDESC